MPQNGTVHVITPPQFIRQHLFRMEVSAIAEVVGVAPSIWSRYELHGRIPERHHDRLRQLAKTRGVKLLQRWFDRVPFEEGVPT